MSSVFTIKSAKDPQCFNANFFFNNAQFALERKKEENVDNMLKRMQLNCERTYETGTRKKGRHAKPDPNEVKTTPSVTISLDRHGLTNAWDVLNATNLIHFNVNGEVINYQIIVDPPAILSVNLHSQALENHPLVPDIVTESIDDDSLLQFKWYRVPRANSMDEEVEIGSGFVFSPPSSCIGHRVKLVVSMPSRPYVSPLSVESGFVQPFTSSWAEERLQNFAKDKNFQIVDENQKELTIRVATYNILAPVFARTKHAATQMFPYCKSGELDPMRRLPMVGKEIVDLDCDIIGLQEVGTSWYDRYLNPLMTHKGYSTHLSLKASGSMEGVALFIKKSTFVMDGEINSILFRDVLAFDPNFESARQEILAKWPHFLTEVLPNLSTIFQIAVVRSIDRPHRYFVIGNTHLFFHPNAPHVRMMQVNVLSSLIQKRAELIKEKDPSAQITPIILGDFNASPESGAAEHLRGITIESTHNSWWRSESFTWGLKAGDGLGDDDNVDEESEDGEEAKESPEDTAAPVLASKRNELEASSEDNQPVKFRSFEAEHKYKVKFGFEQVKAAAESLFRDESYVPSEGLGFKLINPLGELKDVYAIKGVDVEVTNVVNGFRDRLDWIMLPAQSNVKVNKVLQPVPLPVLLGPEQNNGLPCSEYPSDHLALAAELSFC